MSQKNFVFFSRIKSSYFYLDLDEIRSRWRLMIVLIESNDSNFVFAGMVFAFSKAVRSANTFLHFHRRHFFARVFFRAIGKSISGDFPLIRKRARRRLSREDVVGANALASLRTSFVFAYTNIPRFFRFDFFAAIPAIVPFRPFSRVFVPFVFIFFFF